MRTTRSGVALALVMAIVTMLPARGGPRADQVSDNITEIAHFPYTGGTDLDFAGRYVYAARLGDEGGVHVIDISGSKPVEVAFVPCPGSQNDVALVRPGLIALGFATGSCGEDQGAGVRLIDVSNPKRPRYLDSVAFADGTHTLTTYPGGDYVYASPGGLGENGGTQFILDVRNPRAIEVAGEYTPNPFGCHDVSFYFADDVKLGF